MVSPSGGVSKPTLSFADRLPLTRAAVEFARERHVGQLRRGDDAAFIVHPFEVASLLERSEYPDHVVAAGVLHDVLEDTDANRAELEDLFGTEVAGLVATLSDDPSIPGEEARKDEVRERVRQTGGYAVAIYAADKVSKVRELRTMLVVGIDEEEAATRLERYRRSLAMLEEVIPGSRLVELLRFELEALQLLPPKGERLSETAAKPPQVLLRDETTVLVRPVEPGDEDLIRAGFDRLSDESRYRRFLAPTLELAQPMLRYLTHVDHHDHEALVAVDPDSGEGVGIARFVRTGPRNNAEVAVTVVDDWQGRGLGTILLELLAERAREDGIETFSALALATNTDMIDLLRSLGATRVTEREGSCIEVETALPPAGIHPGLRELLRRSADPASGVRPAKSLASAG